MNSANKIFDSDLISVIRVSHRSTNEAVSVIMKSLETPISFQEQKYQHALHVVHTLYISIILGIMLAMSYIAFLSGMFNLQQLYADSITRTAFSGLIFIIIGCLVILLSGKDISVSLLSYMHMTITPFYIAREKKLVVLTGLTLWLWGGFMILHAMFL